MFTFVSVRVCRTTLGRAHPAHTANSSVRPSCPGRVPLSTRATTTHRPRGTSGLPPGDTRTTRPRPAEGPGPGGITSLLPRAAGGTTTSPCPPGTAGTTTPPGHRLVNSATARRPSLQGKDMFTLSDCDSESEVPQQMGSLEI